MLRSESERAILARSIANQEQPVNHHHVDRDEEIRILIETAKRLAQRMNGTFIVDDGKVQSFGDCSPPPAPFSVEKKRA